VGIELLRTSDLSIQLETLGSGWVGVEKGTDGDDE
jgi:hypothetical protein